MEWGVFRTILYYLAMRHGAGTAAVRDAVATETEVEGSTAPSVETAIDVPGIEIGAARAMNA